MHGHGCGGDMDGARGGQQRSVRLGPHIAVCALDATFREGVAGCAVEPHDTRRGRHTALDNPRRTGKRQHLIGGGVAGPVSPGFAFPVGIGHASLLHDGLNALPGTESGVETLAGAGTVGLPGTARDDARCGRSVKRFELSQGVETGLEFAGGDERLPAGRQHRADGDLSRSGSLGVVETTATGQEKVHGRRSEFEILGAGCGRRNLLVLLQLDPVFGVHLGQYVIRRKTQDGSPGRARDRLCAAAFCLDVAGKNRGAQHAPLVGQRELELSGVDLGRLWAFDFELHVALGLDPFHGVIRA